jgi:hypothetical protein
LSDIGKLMNSVDTIGVRGNLSQVPNKQQSTGISYRVR